MNNTSKHKHLIINKQLSFSQALMRVNSQPYSIFYYDLEDKVIKSLAIHQQRFKVSVSLARQAEHKYTTPTRMAKEQGEHLETTNRLIYKTGFIHPRICVNTGISNQGSVLHIAAVQHFWEAVCVRSTFTPICMAALLI